METKGEDADDKVVQQTSVDGKQVTLACHNEGRTMPEGNGHEGEYPSNFSAVVLKME